MPATNRGSAYYQMPGHRYEITLDLTHGGARAFYRSLKFGTTSTVQKNTWNDWLLPYQASGEGNPHHQSRRIRTWLRNQ